jgi:hypothetical protein
MLGYPGAIAITAAIWVFARRRNGFAGLHELASRTRVHLVRRTSALVVPEIPLTETPLSEDVPSNFGPYRTKLLLWKTDGRALVVAHDDVLSHDVWIYWYRDNNDVPGMKELIETRGWVETFSAAGPAFRTRETIRVRCDAA